MPENSTKLLPALLVIILVKFLSFSTVIFLAPKKKDRQQNAYLRQHTLLRISSLVAVMAL